MIQQFATITLGYIASGSLWLLSQVPDVAAFSSWIQYGALGLLGITILGQLYIIVISLRERDNRIETLIEKLNETLTQLRVNCASKAEKKD